MFSVNKKTMDIFQKVLLIQFDAETTMACVVEIFLSTRHKEEKEMLVLTRREGESIVIDNGKIRFTILDIPRGNKVRIGIEASPEICVDREEVSIQRTQKVEKESSQPS